MLLALSDEGAPAYDHAQAAALAELGVPSFACTPDAFPELLAAALEGRDVGRWANEHGLHTAVATMLALARGDVLSVRETGEVFERRLAVDAHVFG